MKRFPQLLCLALVALVPACGGGLGNGDQVRPAVIATFPADGSTVDALYGAFRIDYDMPVVILNATNVSVTADGQDIASEAFRVDGLPNSVFLRPRTSTVYPPDAAYIVKIEPGLATNLDGHYMLENAFALFDITALTPIVLGAGATVHLLDPDDYSFIPGNASVPTPGGSATAIATVDDGTTARTFVQLADADALAFFVPGVDAAMTTIPLTAVGALSTGARTMAAGVLGTYLYAAYRDAGTGGVRVYRIDVSAEAEDAFIDLASVITGPDTEPVSLTLDGSEIYVVCTDGTDATLVEIDVASFTETDLDAVAGGTQGLTLIGPAGPAVATRDFVVIADPDSGEGLRVERANYKQLELTTTQVGRSVDIVQQRASDVVFQPLADFDPGAVRPLQRRVRTYSFTRNATDVLSDLLDETTSAGASSATAFGPAYFPNEFYLILDGQILLSVRWNNGNVLQFDLDPVEPGTQAIDLNVTAPGVTGVTIIGTLVGALPPSP